MVTTTRLMTAEELLNMPDDGYKYELIRGEPKKMSPDGQFHGEYGSNINISLGGYVKSSRLGKTYNADTGFILETDPDTVRAPDVAFISNKRLAEIGESTGYALGAPDVAVEVISPNDRYPEVDEKTAEWLEAGCRAVIVVNPRRRTVDIHRSPAETLTLTESDTLEIDDIVPGWRMAVKDIFE